MLLVIVVPECDHGEALSPLDHESATVSAMTFLGSLSDLIG